MFVLRPADAAPTAIRYPIIPGKLLLYIFVFLHIIQLIHCFTALLMSVTGYLRPYFYFHYTFNVYSLKTSTLYT